LANQLIGKKMNGDIMSSLGLKPAERVRAFLEENEGSRYSVVEIYRELMNTPRHIPLSTLYRVLANLEKKNVIQKLSTDDGTRAVYEYTGGKKHGHLVCRKCSLTLPVCDEKLNEIISSIARKQQSEVVSSNLTIYTDCLTWRCKNKGHSR